jgi:hypothetical protein
VLAEFVSSDAKKGALKSCDHRRRLPLVKDLVSERNCTPALGTVYLHRFLQLAIFVFCPFTRTSILAADDGIQTIVTSVATLYFRSTRDQRGNYDTILTTVRLYRIMQFAVFDCCPLNRTFIRLVDVGIQRVMPSGPFDPEPAQQQHPHSCYHVLAPPPLACCLCLLPIYPYVKETFGQCWDPRHYPICSSTDFSFDSGPSPQLHSNSRHRAFVPHPSACCLRLLPIYRTPSTRPVDVGN